MDLERIVQTVTLRLIGTLDIEEALVNTRNALAQWMPADEMILFQMSEAEDEVYLICRIAEAGVLSMDRQSLLILNERQQAARQSQLSTIADDVLVLRRCDMTKEISEKPLADTLSRFGLPPNSDDLVLYDRRIKAGIGVVCYQAAQYSDVHVQLFRQLREIFGAAITNAIRFQELRRNRDALIDDNQLFREVTVRLTGEADIAKAFQNTLHFLADHLPLSELMLITTDPAANYQQLLLRVHTDGTIDNPGDVIDLSAPAEVMARRMAILEALPETFVTELRDHEFITTLNSGNREEKMLQLGISPDAPIAALGVKAVQAAVLFVFTESHSYRQEHLEMIRLLKEPFVIGLHNAIRFFELERIRERLQAENRALQNELQREVGDRVVGMHQGLKQVMELATQVARTVSPVLLLGETGSGKEVIATTIHRLSPRMDSPFVSINCGAIPETLIDSELFGHEKGSFTGASERKLGRFERAEGGTLFLDEVGELPPSAQVKLLRVLQEKEFERVGGNRSIRADVRLIAATNRDLPAMVRRGEFREDLWFRLNVFPITIPPLRQRREDIPALAYFFIESGRRHLNLPYRPSLPAAELDKLVQYDWPGNVRELQNAIERALILSRGEPLQFPLLASVFGVGSLSPSLRPPAATPPLSTWDEMSRTYFRSVLEATNGRISGPRGAAILTGLNANTLRSKLKKLGML